MYTLKRYTMRVRAAGSRYGEPAVPEESFTCAGVLRDLSDAPDHDVPLILARYAALRAWVLRCRPWDTREPEDPVVVEHALSAARAHLAATAAAWPEARVLEVALARATRAGCDPGGDPDVAGQLALLEEAARAADVLGHVHGARALRQAAHRVRWRASGFPPSSLS